MTVPSRLQGKVAIVTGGARGLGRGIATVLAREGANIAVADLAVQEAQDTLTAVEGEGCRAVVVETDVTDACSAERCIRETITRLGGVDVLVNNAGVVGGHLGEQVTAEDWDDCFAVNVKGPWIMGRALLPHFKQRGGGKVVNISSIGGREGVPMFPNYSASKAALINLTQAQALDWARYNVNVNAVCPGLIWTQMWRLIESHAEQERGRETEDRVMFERFVRKLTALGREQTPEDVGHAVAFLASEEARNITGQSINVDGGIKFD